MSQRRRGESCRTVVLEDVLRLRSQGLTQSQIAAALGTTRQVVRDRLRRAGRMGLVLHAPPPPVVRVMRSCLYCGRDSARCCCARPAFLLEPV